MPNAILDSVSSDFSKFGEEVLSKTVLDWVTDAERNMPYLRGGGRDAFGKGTSELVVTEGWKRLQDFGIQNGYESSFKRITSYMLNSVPGLLLQDTKISMESTHELCSS